MRQKQDKWQKLTIYYYIDKKMIEKITIDDIRETVKKCVNILLEHTNMKTLYHFTILSKFVNIAKTNRLNSADYDKAYFGNSDHISFTRHRSNLEGFAKAAFTDNNAIARIEIDAEKLNSRHYVQDFKPIEFYSPNRERYDTVGGRKIPKKSSGKSRYQDKDYYYQNKNKFNSPVYVDRLEYHNQAEETLMMQDNVQIENLSKYVNRVDIYDKDIEEALMGFSRYKGIINDFIKIANTNFAKMVPIYIYKDKRDFILQSNNCIRIQDVINQINN